jgi:hypothetical protein
VCARFAPEQLVATDLLRVGDMMFDGVFRQMVLRPLVLSGLANPESRGRSP